MASTKNRWKAFLLAVLCGGAPLATSATCDPRNGTLSVFRGNDGPAIVDVFYDDYYYDDGYYDDGYYDDYYYDDGYYYEDDCLFLLDCF